MRWILLPGLRISIHTSLAGGDNVQAAHIFLYQTRFQSTPPSREATFDVITVYGTISISIHTSLAGGDHAKMRKFEQPDISIHTSLAGGD